MSDEESLPTAEELAEAEALARALEGDAPAGEPALDDVVATAALLRRARDTQSNERRLEEDRRIAEGVAPSLAALDARRRRRGRWRWLAPAVLVPAAAAAVLIATAGRHAGPGAPPVPAPPLALFEAQARAASGRADLALLDREMRAYRETVYAALGERRSPGGEP